MTGGNGECCLQQHGEHHSSDEKIDERRVECVRTAKPRRPDDVTLPRGEAETGENDNGKNVLQQGNPGIAADRRQAEPREKAGPERLDDRREQHNEAAEDHGVKDAGIADFQQALMKADRAQHAEHARAGLIESRV